MPVQPDLLVYDHQGRLSALVEVKNKRGTTPEWASVLRRNLAAHGSLHVPGIFLLFTPDRIYIWKHAAHVPEVIPPDFVVEPKPVLQQYFERAGVTPEDVGGQAFEMVVAAWLADLAYSGDRPPDEEWLRESGFLEAIRNGRVEYQVAA